MSFRSCIFKAFSVPVAAALLWSVAPSSALGGGADRGRSIEFSTPKSDEISTNIHQLTSKKDSLKQLEEDAYKTFQAFTPGGSLDGVPVNPIRPPATPAVPSKRLKEKLERQKNYLWMTPEDLMTKTTIEDMLKVPEYGPDGQLKNDKPSMERYYEHLGDQSKTKTANPFASLTSPDDESMSKFGSQPRRDPLLGSDVDMPSQLKESAMTLRKLFDDDSDEKINGPKPVRSGFNDVFGLADPTADSRQKELEHKKLMDEYRTILDPSWHPVASSDSLQPFDNSLDTPLSKPAFPATTPGSQNQPSRKFADTLTGPVPPVALQPPVDATVQALGQYNNTPTIPKVDLPKQGPLRPNFEFPKRPGL